jgi:hypothetical protein
MATFSKFNCLPGMFILCSAAQFPALPAAAKKPSQSSKSAKSSATKTQKDEVSYPGE